MKYTIIYDLRKKSDLEFTANYRVYDEHRNVITDGSYTYTIAKPRPMTPGLIRQKVVTGIRQRCIANNTMLVGVPYKAVCLDSGELSEDARRTKKVIIPSKTEGPKQITIDMPKPEKPSNPRIYRVVLINNNYTIVKAENQYLTREQAKEELFNRQLDEA